MSRYIHIFNPDTDYALACDREYYTPPKHVVELRKSLALLPALYAYPGDYILLMDMPDDDMESLKYADIAKTKGINILVPDKKVCSKFDDCNFTFEPWGWNKNVRRFVADLFPDITCLPSLNRLSELRNLSHRRTTIKMFETMQPELHSEINCPTEITYINVAIKRFADSPYPLFFKAPWSSSGRGILFTEGLDERHVIPWLRGIIRKQGSVIAEKAYRRRIDFASEWRIDIDGSPKFLGYSVFNVSRRGKYHSNILADQSQLKRMIINECGENELDRIIEAQKFALRKVIGDRYTGPVGIDMLVTESGNINPCVELNLRRTMGMLQFRS